MRTSWEGLFEAHKGLIRAEGKDFRMFFEDINEFKKWWSPNWRENEREIGIKDLGAAHQIFYETVGRYLCLLPWTKNVLEKLSKKYEMAVLTNRHRANAMGQLSPVAHYFEIIVGAEDIQNLKPHPEGVKLILEKTKILPEETLIIGDMSADLQAGKLSGTKTGAVIWEYGLGIDENFAKLDFEPDYIFRTPSCFHRHLL